MHDYELFNQMDEILELMDDADTSPEYVLTLVRKLFEEVTVKGLYYDARKALRPEQTETTITPT